VAGTGTKHLVESGKWDDPTGRARVRGGCSPAPAVLRLSVRGQKITFLLRHVLSCGQTWRRSDFRHILASHSQSFQLSIRY
jgi:hypothetical protein